MEQTIQEKHVLRKKRRVNNLWVLGIIVPVQVVLFRWYNDIAAWLTGADKAQIADLGPEIIQPLFVTLLYIAGFSLFSVLMASLYENQVRETAFGNYSRFGVLFVLFFLGCCLVAQGIL